MKKVTFTTLAIFLFALVSNAQTAELSLISTAGGEFKTNNETLTFTVGEIVTETFTSTDLILTQGFLQPFAETVGLSQNNELPFSVNIYPNPASSYFYLKIDSNENEKYILNILDIKGKKISTQELTEENSKINISNCQPGTYFIRLINKSSTYDKTFVLIKTND